MRELDVAGLKWVSGYPTNPAEGLTQQVLGPDRQVGILCAFRRFLTDTHLLNVGIDPASSIVVADADELGCGKFDNL